MVFTRSRISVFYGWIIVVAGIVITGAGIDIYSMTNSAFIIPVCQELELSRGAFTFHRTLITIVSALSMSVFGALIRKYGVKRLMLISSIGLFLVMLGYSCAGALWHFYLCAIGHGAFTNGVGFLLVGTLVNDWFDDKKGLATGIAYCGTGIGGALALPLATELITRVGWRMTYRILGIAGILIMLPVILFLIRNTPEEMGLTPYHDPGSEPKNGKTEQDDFSGIILRDAVRKPVFWFIAIAFLGTSICACGPNTHTVPYLQDIGYTAQHAASIMSFCMICLSGGKILLGMFFDHLGTKAGSLFVGICCVIAPILAIFSGSPVLAYSFALILGFATSGYSVPVSTLVRKHFGALDFPVIFSVFTGITTVGGILSIPVMGWIFDRFGSYYPAWIFLAVIGAVTLAAFILSETDRPEYRA